MNTTTHARSLIIMDCRSASTADQDRGICAAEAVFKAANLTPEHCHAQIMAQAAGDAWGTRGVSTWQDAEAAAIAACCAGWHRVPESAHLELG